MRQSVAAPAKRTAAEFDDLKRAKGGRCPQCGRVVVGANVFASAAGWSGAPHRIAQRWLKHDDFEIVACPRLLAEVRDMLTGRPWLRARLDLGTATGCAYDRAGSIAVTPITVLVP